MIFGIGTDIAQIERLGQLWQRHGDAGVARILAPEELNDFAKATDKGRFLAKRFAAKEALGKALGTGIRAPVLLPAIAIHHDEWGKPFFAYDDNLAAFMSSRKLKSFLTISDERDYAVAFVVVEHQ